MLLDYTHTHFVLGPVYVYICTYMYVRKFGLGLNFDWDLASGLEIILVSCYVFAIGIISTIQKAMNVWGFFQMPANLVLL